MRTVLLFLVCLLEGSYYLYSQSIELQIEEKHNMLDSVSYINDVLVAYKENLLFEMMESKKLELELTKEEPNLSKNKLEYFQQLYQTIVDSLDFEEDLLDKKKRENISVNYFQKLFFVQKNIGDPIIREQMIDSIEIEFLKESMVADYTMLVYQLNTLPIHFVLNLQLDSCKSLYLGRTIPLRVDISRLPFNLFCFNTNQECGLFLYCKKGKYSWKDTRYRSFSRQLGQNAPKVFRNIMKKRPDYILYCDQLEGMNTILYMKDECIYVYRIIEMEEYELSEYLEKFKGEISVKFCL